jgi:hypothetical protein
MMKNMREQFSVPKPDDRFVADMLQHLARKYNAPQCANLGVKVVHCGTSEGWVRMWPLARDTVNRKMLANEYREMPEVNLSTWLKVNLFLFQGVKRNIDSDKIVSASENERLSFMVGHGVGARLADALSQFDAVIFVHTDNIIRADRAGIVFPLHSPLTHEALHIIEVRTEKNIISGFNPREYHDPVSLAVLEEFITKVGWDEFNRRYFLEPETN